MALSKSRRSLVLAAIAALVLVLGSVLATTLLAPVASASGGVNVSNLAINSVTIDPQTKVATAKGMVTCTGARRVEMYVNVTQSVGRLHTVYAEGYKTIACDGQKSFKIPLTYYQGSFRTGYASVNASAYAESAAGYDYAEVSQLVRVTNAQ